MVFKEEKKETEMVSWDVIRQEIQAEIEQTDQELKEINLMMEQSQLEVSRLAQKNALVTAQLQQLHGHFDTSPREDIRMTYDEALDAQQRLFVMRGQSEKLQSDHKHLEKYKEYLEKVMSDLSVGSPPSQSKGTKGVLSTVESIIQAQESERQRLSRQMHDGPAQALSNFILQTEIALRLFDMDQEKARQELVNLKDSATSAFQQVRDFVFELRPMMLDDLGLVPTLKRYVEAFKEQTNTNVRLSVSGVERRMESYIEVIIFRAVQEILGYVVRQGQATQISIQMDISDAQIKTTLDDNGKGIDAMAITEGAGMGIKVIKDRVEMLGGFLEIDGRPGKGNLIVFQVPAGTSGQSVFA
jgi:two-component system sensor histidine kinase DegS